MEFVQDNHSKSKKGVLRGLHFQTQNTQGKLVRVAKGSVYDVAVDLRKDSETFGKWYGVLLTEANKTMFYVPEGFAHGFLTLEDDYPVIKERKEVFLTLEDDTEFMYKCTDLYSPEYDSGIMWNDETIGIDWKFEEFGIDPSELTISDKDTKHQNFDRNKKYFEKY